MRTTTHLFGHRGPHAGGLEQLAERIDHPRVPRRDALEAGHGGHPLGPLGHQRGQRRRDRLDLRRELPLRGNGHRGCRTDSAIVRRGGRLTPGVSPFRPLDYRGGSGGGALCDGGLRGPAAGSAVVWGRGRRRSPERRTEGVK